MLEEVVGLAFLLLLIRKLKNETTFDLLLQDDEAPLRQLGHPKPSLHRGLPITRAKSPQITALSAKKPRFP
jgi:hypothetical protein